MKSIDEILDGYLLELKPNLWAGVPHYEARKDTKSELIQALLEVAPEKEWDEQNSDGYEYNLGYHKAIDDYKANLKGLFE